MLFLNCTFRRSFQIFSRFPRIAVYKFPIRSIDTSSFDKKGRAEENRYYFQKQNEQLRRLKMQLQRLEANQKIILDELHRATDVIKVLRDVAEAAAAAKKKTEETAKKITEDNKKVKDK